MNSLFRTLAPGILMMLIISCSGSGSGKKNSESIVPEPGVVHTSIACAGNRSLSYALYIPKGSYPGKDIPSTHLFPLIIAFDPHGDGSLPLTKYQALAEKFGIMFIGSNNSKNGLPATEIQEIVNGLMTEARAVYPVDTSRIYLLGFSGGARVAAMAGLYQVQVKGVIGCGAGFGNTQQPVRYKFDYYGMAGTADFNMRELLQMEEPLTSTGFRHFIATFPGIHAWPSYEAMEDAVTWITLNAFRDRKIPQDNAFISGADKLFTDRINQLKNRNDLIAADGMYRMAISFLEGLTTVDKYRSERAALEGLPSYRSQQAYREKILQLEEKEKQELAGALQEKEIAWWKMKISDMEHRLSENRLKNSKVNPEDTLKDRRVMAFLSLYCYMNANAAVSQQDELSSARLITIYELADKVNPEPNYMRAILYARHQESEAAIGQLTIAIKKGFTDKQRLLNQVEFQPMTSSPSWVELLKTIR
ncbi:MAG: hypothetical protein ACOYNC_01915 [Bacteroidales bacterium]